MDDCCIAYDFLLNICMLSHSVTSNSLFPVLYPARLLCPWDSPGKSTGVAIPEKQTTQSKSGKKTKTDISPKKTYRWLTNTWKDVPHCLSLEKCKSKLQSESTSHQSEWSSSKSLKTMNAREDVEKREHSCTLGGNVNWYSHYGRWYGDSLKNWE